MTNLIPFGVGRYVSVQRESEKGRSVQLHTFSGAGGKVLMFHGDLESLGKFVEAVKAAHDAAKQLVEAK